MSARMYRWARGAPGRAATALSFSALLSCAVASGCGDSHPPYWYGGAGAPCGNDLDCPAYSYCIEPDPGYCLVPCRSTLDCAPPYLCASRNRRGTKGKMDVCYPPP